MKIRKRKERTMHEQDIHQETVFLWMLVVALVVVLAVAAAYFGTH
jgi:hypothetical protein